MDNGSTQARQDQNPLHHITRLDYQNTHGWWVRIRRNPKSCSKLFSDGVWGGRDEALEEAIAWRDEQLSKLPPPGKRQNESSSKGIKTGVTGLSLVLEEGRQGNTLPHVQVSVQRNGKHISRKYSIGKWGLRGALWKACVVIAKPKTGKPSVDERESVQKRAMDLYNISYKRIAQALEEHLEPDEVEGLV